MKGARFPYDEWLMSGRAIFLTDEDCYPYPPSEVKQKLHLAGKRRGLKVATRTVFEPPGFVFQAHLPNHVRPELPLPTQGVSINSHPWLYCTDDGCDNKLRPKDHDGRCVNHK